MALYFLYLIKRQLNLNTLAFDDRYFGEVRITECLIQNNVTLANRQLNGIFAPYGILFLFISELFHL